MNFHEFGLGIGWIKVFCNIGVFVSLIVWGIRIFVGILKALD